MERTKSDTAEITQSIRLLDPGNDANTYSCPEHSGDRLPPKQTGVARGRKWQPTPMFLAGESQGLGSLVGCRLWGRGL